MKLKFYDVDCIYTDYLREFDKRIPYIGYENRNKFLCGIVLNINDINYYVPVSSNKTKYFSSFIIYDEKKDDKIPISSLRFSFMFPCDNKNINLKDINAEKDLKYRELMRKEYKYCNKYSAQIIKKANKIYELAQKKELREKYNLCDFKLLEEKFYKYNKRKLKLKSYRYIIYL